MSNQHKEENHPIWSLCRDSARNLYGDSIPEMIACRMEEELQHILRNGFAEPYLVAGRIVDKANADGYFTRIRGSVGASFVAYLLGITEINPLPPHYRCLKCRHVEWVKDITGSGFDIPTKKCPECGGDYKGDGHKIPYEMFLGINGDKSPNIGLYVAKEFKERAQNVLKLPIENHEVNREFLLPKLVECDNLSIMKRLHTLTGVSPRSIPMNDPKVLSLFRSTAELGVASEQINTKVATYGIPEMGLRWVREMLEQTQPSSFSELIQINGLSHGTGTWEGNARERIQAGAGSLTTSIAFRDQLMTELMEYGIGADTAYAITEDVRKGKGVSVSDREALLKYNVPAWYIESCEKIKYMFPRSHAVSYTILAVRSVFYKLYYPLAFYTAYFTVRAGSMEMEICARGEKAIMKSLEDQHQANRFLLELALEMTARGFRIKRTTDNAVNGYFIEGENGSLEVPLK